MYISLCFNANYISASFILFLETCCFTSSDVGGAGMEAILAAKFFAVQLRVPVELTTEESTCLRYMALAMISTLETNTHVHVHVIVVSTLYIYM